MLLKTPVRLGDVVKDKITGLEGVVTGLVVYTNGTEQLGVQSEQLEQGKPVDIVWFEAPQVDIIQTQKLNSPQFHEPIPLGSCVKDKVSGLSGTIHSMSLWLHGCIRYSFLPTGLDKEGKPYELIATDEIYLSLAEGLGVTPLPKRGGPLDHKPTSATRGSL
jgi:hypothetical protein